MMRTPTLLRVLRSPSRRLLCPRAGALVGSRGLCAPARRAAPAATVPANAFTDIDLGTWVNRWLPAAAVPFAQLGRWDRPIGTWLLLWPCMWSTALAAPPGLPPDLALCAAFGVGAFVMRGAGCTINDLWDRDIDRQVERTRMRPLASGAVSVPAAIGFLGAQLTCGLCVLLTLPPAAVVLGLASTPLWVLYPLAKRVTNWPQAVLGLAFNWGALMGSTALHGSCDWPVALPLYAGCWWWTMMYDTIYAHQDKADDARAGVLSTALRLGEHSRAWLALFALGCVGSLAVAGLSSSGAAPGVHLPALGAGLACGAAHLAWQLRTVDLHSRADCLRKFQPSSTEPRAVLAVPRLATPADASGIRCSGC